MENKKNYKKLIIICSVVVLFAVLLLVGALIYKNNKANDLSDEQGYEMTYEDFTFGMKDDLSEEVKQQVKEIYNDYVAAVEKNDNDAIDKVFAKLDELSVYSEEDEELNGAFFDENGDDAIYENEEESEGN
jgi:hypothetical protein